MENIELLFYRMDQLFVYIQALKSVIKKILMIQFVMSACKVKPILM